LDDSGVERVEMGGDVGQIGGSDPPSPVLDVRPSARIPDRARANWFSVTKGQSLAPLSKRDKLHAEQAAVEVHRIINRRDGQHEMLSRRFLHTHAVSP
jgi:hypothetical protein